MLPARDIGDVKCVDCGQVVPSVRLRHHYEDDMHIKAVLKNHDPNFLERVLSMSKPSGGKKEGR
jgi:hypothetical protein